MCAKLLYTSNAKPTESAEKELFVKAIKGPHTKDPQQFSKKRKKESLII